MAPHGPRSGRCGNRAIALIRPVGQGTAHLHCFPVRKHQFQRMSEWFDRCARSVANASGSWISSFAAISLVVAWCIAGLWIGFGDLLFQMIINTATTIVTFLMVFVIQHTQVRDTDAMQLKLDELILALDTARNEFRGIERCSEAEIRDLVEGDE